MNLTGQTKRNRVSLLWLLLVFLTASCGAAELPESVVAEITPAAPPAQPVEYGASLSEWEEAVQTDPEKTEDAQNMNSGVVESQGMIVTTTIPITRTEAANAAAATAMDSVVSPQATPTPSLFTLDGVVYQEIMWDALVPADFTADAIMAKYADQLAQFQDGSPEAYDLYMQMQAEFNNAPVNELIDGTMVKLPGFIAPLEYTDSLITEFLLVPYFGACIHVPPPPANQTVLVKTAEGHGIESKDSYSPVWIIGKLTAEGTTTALAAAGYYMEDAIIEPYYIVN